MAHPQQPSGGTSPNGPPFGGTSPNGTFGGNNGNPLMGNPQARVPLSQRKGRKPGLTFKPASPQAAPTPLDELLDKKGDLGRIRIMGQVVSGTENDVDDISLLGTGAFGTVRKMRHKQLNFEMAVKQIRDSKDEQLRKQLLTDLEVIKKCSCPYIVDYYGFHFTEGEIWIFMELMRTSFDKLYREDLKPRSVLFPEEILGTFAVSTLNGLHYLKEKQGVMHRDVKPSNILLGFDGSVKLCDFGIAKIMEKSISKTAVGCERYLPPERLDPETSRQPYDVRSDVWAFGVTLVELARLKYPYPEDHMFQRLTAIVSGDVPTIPEDQYSAEFADFVSLCLSKKRDYRPKYDKSPVADASLPSLLDHGWIVKHARTPADVATWYSELVSSDAT